MFTLEHATYCDLDEIYGVIQVSGKDASKFLQGQITNDIHAVDQQHHILAALCTVQGRVISTFRIFSLEPEKYILVLSKDLIELTLSTLKRYILRSKVTLENISASYKLYGLWTPSSNIFPNENNFAYHEEEIFIQYSNQPLRSLWIRNQPYIFNSHSISKIEASVWIEHNIQEKIPEITALTSGLFTAHSLNFLNLGGISLTKGCYTGQEIIARTHYRGKVKEQLYTTEVKNASKLSPGKSIFLDVTQQQCLGTFITLDSEKKIALVSFYSSTINEKICPFIAYSNTNTFEIINYK